MSSDPRRFIVRCRLSYSYLAVPSPAGKKNLKDPNAKIRYNYRTQLLIPKTDKVNLAKLQNAVKHAIAKQFGKEKVAAYMKHPNFKRPLRDADAEQREGSEYKGMMFANANTNASGPEDYASRPGIALKNRQKLTEPEQIKEHIYSGCYAHVSCTAFYFPPESGQQGIALALNNILKDKDGERLDGSIDALDEFDELMEEDDGFGDFDELGGNSSSADDFGFDDVDIAF